MLGVSRNLIIHGRKFGVPREDLSRFFYFSVGGMGSCKFGVGISSNDMY